METSLQLKHLAPYLTYGLQLHETSRWTEQQTIFELTSLSTRKDAPINPTSGSKLFTDVKPLLIPLSECTEFLNRENGIELDSSMLVYNESCKSINIYPDGSEWTHSMDVYTQIYEWLFEHHFDVFGLIDSGLALNKFDYLK